MTMPSTVLITECEDRLEDKEAHRKPRYTHKGGKINIISIPVHKGKPIKQELLRDQIAKAGLTVKEFLKLYKKLRIDYPC